MPQGLVRATIFHIPQIGGLAGLGPQVLPRRPTVPAEDQHHTHGAPKGTCTWQLVVLSDGGAWLEVKSCTYFIDQSRLFHQAIPASRFIYTAEDVVRSQYKA